MKRTYHADPKNAEWTAQRDHADPRETKTILKKKEKKILDEPLQDEAAQSTPTAWPHQCDFEFNFRFNSGQCFHLMGTFLHRLPQHFQLLGMWGYASVSDGWTSLVRVTALPRRFKPLCSLLDKKRLSSLLSIITSPCSLGVRPTVSRLGSWGYI